MKRDDPHEATEETGMELGTVILTKTAKAGQKIEIRLTQWGPASCAVQVEIDGQPAGKPSSQEPYRIPPIQGMRYGVGDKPVIVLTDEQAETVRAAMRAADETLRVAYEQTDEGRTSALMTERINLVAAVVGAYDAWSAARERAFDEDTGVGFPTEDHINAAKRALADFDAAHPEIKAVIDAARDEERERNIRAAAWS